MCASNGRQAIDQPPQPPKEVCPPRSRAFALAMLTPADGSPVSYSSWTPSLPQLSPTKTPSSSTPHSRCLRHGLCTPSHPPTTVSHMLSRNRFPDKGSSYSNHCWCRDLQDTCRDLSPCRQSVSNAIYPNQDQALVFEHGGSEYYSFR